MGGMTKQGLQISSRAMYASYAWHQPTDTLFDCGEGVSRDLLARIFGIRRVCFSHGHQDHIGGLISLIGLRAKTKGDTGKSLDIFYPADNVQFALVREYVAKSWPRLPYKLTWYPVDPGFEIQLGGTHRLRAFPMNHQPRATTLGWKVIESRSRLKPEYRGQDIRALIAAGATKDTLNEVYHQNTLVYALDHITLDPTDIAGADCAIMDCTFLKEGDRNDNTHATLDESVALCRAAGVRHLICAHISTRYSLEHQREVADRLTKELDIPTSFCFTEGILEL